jgi:putative restriction endonuclease
LLPPQKASRRSGVGRSWCGRLSLAKPARYIDKSNGRVRAADERIMSRPIRDAAFRNAVQSAYGSTCAMTGIKIINGGGRAEVQAAHIRPISRRGPDSVRNGTALSGSVHWMFDRGLISVGPPPDYEILVSAERLPEDVRRWFNPSMMLRKPTDARLWPAPAHLDFHRSEIFKA